MTNITDELVKNITIVISVKDTYYVAHTHLEQVLSSAPNIPILYVLSYPISENLRSSILAMADTYANLNVIDSGLFFCNPFLLRNLAIPHIKTKYILFLFNDVFPVGNNWLIDLYSEAENHPDADIFQPFIWESQNKAHASWNALTFLESNREYYASHVFDNNIHSIRDPASELKSCKQDYYLEDHAFLIRTDSATTISILDPGAAYTLEYLDMALSAKYMGHVIRSVPDSKVIYESQYNLKLDDLLIFSYRRCEELGLASTAYICKKWGFRYRTQRVWNTITDEQLRSIKLDSNDLPTGIDKQLELLLSLFVSIGFNRFLFSSRHEHHLELPELTLPEVYQSIINCKDLHEASSVFLQPLFKNEIPAFPAHSEDHHNRQLQLREGQLFPVDSSTQLSVSDSEYNISYNQFYIIECSGFVMEPERARILFDDIPSLIMEKKIDQRVSRFKVYLHAREPGIKKTRYEQLARALGNKTKNPGGLKLGRARLESTSIKLTDCMSEDTSPIILGPGQQGWQVFYWSWKVYDIAQLEDLFHVYRWRRTIRLLIRRAYHRLFK